MADHNKIYLQSAYPAGDQLDWLAPQQFTVCCHSELLQVKQAEIEELLTLCRHARKGRSFRNAQCRCLGIDDKEVSRRAKALGEECSFPESH